MQKELTGKPTRKSHAVMQTRTRICGGTGTVLTTLGSQSKLCGGGSIELSLKDK